MSQKSWMKLFDMTRYCQVATSFLGTIDMLYSGVWEPQGLTGLSFQSGFVRTASGNIFHGILLVCPSFPVRPCWLLLSSWTGDSSVQPCIHSATSSRFYFKGCHISLIWPCCLFSCVRKMISLFLFHRRTRLSSYILDSENAVARMRRDSLKTPPWLEWKTRVDNTPR